MKADDFLSTPDELLPAAISFGDSMLAAGWKVKIEAYDLAFPKTPLFSATRQHTHHIVEVQPGLDFDLIEEWVRYCKSCDKDTRFLVLLAMKDMPDAADVERAKALGIGLVMAGTGNVPLALLTPIDLALSLELPDVPPEYVTQLGSAYEQFGRGEWREGFEAAALVFEQEARQYLKTHVNRGRVTFAKADGTPKIYSVERIGKMTLGNLATAYSEIRQPNVADTRIAQCLATINEDRVTVVHYKGKQAARERKLRKNVKRHMFVIVNGLRHIKGTAATR